MAPKRLRARARHRVNHRYDLSYTEALRNEIITKIQKGESTLEPGNKVTRTSRAHRVTLNDGTSVVVIYNKKYKEIVTFLPDREK